MKLFVTLLSAPLVAVIARALMTPQYQDKADQLDTTRYLNALADASARNDLGALLATASAVLYVATALSLARIARNRLGTVGAALSVVGAFGIFAVAVFAMVAGRLAQESDRAAAAALLERLNNAPVFASFVLALLIGAIGSVLLGIGLFRSRRVPRAAALVAGIGGAGLMLTAPGPLVSFVVGAAILALIGLLWVALGATQETEQSESVAVGTL
ncbi:DUF4386 family protein [Kribbella sp. NPDC056951]|uniref:DUF4386 family protein n=1 Tax=Kribbella sp. NPDC056951 TaxID=3345978 RepID=UPI0036337FE6